MSARLFIVLVAGVIAVIGVVGLSITVSVSDSVGRTQSIPCGNGWSGDVSEAEREGSIEDLTDVMIGYISSNQEEAYTQGCLDALKDRRMWAWPMAGAGVVALLGGLFINRKPSDWWREFSTWVQGSEETTSHYAKNIVDDTDHDDESTGTSSSETGEEGDVESCDERER